jgi:hypothetical protein
MSVKRWGKPGLAGLEDTAVPDFPFYVFLGKADEDMRGF